MTADEAFAFVRRHGVVLASAKGPVPRLVEAIAGEPIKGSWWAHPKGHQIFAILGALGESPEILTCRLLDGKVTFVHRRLWPALVRVADRFAPERLAQVREEHTASGYHVRREVPFPEWVPGEVLVEGKGLSEVEAQNALGELVRSATLTPGPSPASGRGERGRRKARVGSR
ncbi:MAG TPA: hypothetical protein VF229_03810 [Burkholderiaceae bacterium]